MFVFTKEYIIMEDISEEGTDRMGSLWDEKWFYDSMKTRQCVCEKWDPLYIHFFLCLHAKEEGNMVKRKILLTGSNIK